MRKIWLVLRYELIHTITRPSFLFAAVGIPLIGALLFFGLSALNRRSPEAVTAVFGTNPSEQIQTKPEGYVDQADLIRTIPDSTAPDALRSFPDEASAEKALKNQEIGAYYLIPADYLAQGQIFYIRPDFNPLNDFNQTYLMQWVLQVNLLGGNVPLASQVAAPMHLEVKLLEPPQGRDQDNPLSFYLPYGVTFIYYIILLMSSSLLLSSVTKEKENRVIEILMSSISPRQMLTGKIAGLGLASLFQMILWAGTGFTLLRLGGNTFQLPPDFQLPVSFLVWGLVFFLLGYAVYASLMAAVGALAPNLREASQATVIVILPIIVPMMFVNILIQEPNSVLSLVLSMFPLTSPIAMVTRMAAISVPVWQLLLSAGLLAATAVLIVRAVAGMFRAQTLLSGQPFSIKRLLNAVTGRG
jgi:ABC-2 type transport system permease protein